MAHRTRTTTGAARLVALVTWLGAAGCDATLAGDLDEAQANAIVEALARAGITARKARGSGEAGHEVRVEPSDLTRGLAVLRAEALPRERAPGLGEVFGKGGLVPTPTEERARLAAAIAGELATTLEGLEGVRRARVHVALPERAELALDPSIEPPRPEASVLLSVAAGAEGLPDEDVRRLVAGAVEGLRADDVAIVRAPAAGDGAPARAAAAELVRVGPFLVAPASAGALRVSLVVACLLLGAMAAALVVVAARARRRIGALEAALVMGEGGSAPSRSFARKDVR